jgi:hypothetical protein
MPTLDEVITALTEAGFTVRNLFQVKEGWRAHIHDTSDAEASYVFGCAATPAEALLCALKAAGVTIDD